MLRYVIKNSLMNQLDFDKVSLAKLQQAKQVETSADQYRSSNFMLS